MPKDKALWYSFFALAAGVSCVIALLTATDLPEWIVLLLVLGGIAFFLGAAKGFGLFRAPLPIGVPLRILIVVGTIVALMSYLGFKKWPRITIEPQEVAFHPDASRETYTFTVSNQTPSDRYNVGFFLRIQPDSASVEDVQIEVPKPSSKPLTQSGPGASVADVSGLGCRTAAGEPLLFITIPRLKSKESREILVTGTALSPITVTSELTGSSTEPAPIIWTENRVMHKMTIPERLTCTKGFGLLAK